MNLFTKGTLVGIALFQLSACSSFPDHGKGGNAEHVPGQKHTFEKMIGIEDVYSLDESVSVNNEQRLLYSLEMNQRHLDVLVLEGAELCFPATVVQAKTREKRIARQVRAGLTFDSANDLIIQKKLLHRLEKQLDYVKSNNVCQLPTVNTSIKQKKPGEIAAQIYELLNADNQFAFDSFELNPKYVVRLSKAANLLKDVPQYGLKITGHADSVGAKNDNQDLSMKRAEKVSRYLQIMGINENRIKVTANGEMSPLFEGSQPEIRLVNRRVSIEVLELNDTNSREK